MSAWVVWLEVHEHSHLCLVSTLVRPPRQAQAVHPTQTSEIGCKLNLLESESGSSRRTPIRTKTRKAEIIATHETCVIYSSVKLDWVGGVIDSAWRMRTPAVIIWFRIASSAERALRACIASTIALCCCTISVLTPPSIAPCAQS